MVKAFIDKCEEEFGVTVEIKNVFENSVFYGLKNGFVAWSGNENDEPVEK